MTSGAATPCCSRSSMSPRPYGRRTTPPGSAVRSRARSSLGGGQEEARPARGSLDYLIFVTNVELSSVAIVGGIDTVEAHLVRLLGPGSKAQKAKLKIRGVKVWHADQVRAMLDARQDIRWAFPALLTVGDVLTALQIRRNEQVGEPFGTNTLEDPLRRHLLSGLTNDRWIRLGQAGSTGNDKMSLTM